MKGPQFDDSPSRFRFVESCLGLIGCLSICSAVCVNDWLDGKGMWYDRNQSNPEWQSGSLIKGVWAQDVFIALSFLMAVSSGVLCLVFAFCWTNRTVLSYSNTRSLMMAGQALYPTTLLLITLTPTGLFFLVSWALFTSKHIADITDPSQLGLSYWLGAGGLVLLLVVFPVVFLVEQCVVPDVLPELKKTTDIWWKPHEIAYLRSFSENYQYRGHHYGHKHKRQLSVP